jgi:L-alanine-DL-glutamate epimerase-like enolase superfamily enzyme
VEIPAKDGSYSMSRDRVLRSFPSTVVQVTAEDGTSGFGEACTLGANYLDGFPGSARATINELAPFVLECDPLEPNVLVDGMDYLVIGHLPGKAAIDNAMWDLRGKLLGLPVARLLGGVKQHSFGAFQAISLGSPAAMAAEVTRMADLGFRRWQLKLGGHSGGRSEADRLERAEQVLFDPAEQACHGKVQQLAAEVPHRDVDGGLAGQMAGDERVHPVGQYVRLERITLEYEGS